MEILRGIKIRDIFLDNQNWWRFYLIHEPLIRDSIIENVCKVLSCGTKHLGFHKYTCPTCNETKKVFHTCKSRFCSSCGKKATEQWIETNLNVLPNTSWQHITFTLPQELRSFFWLNRHIFNLFVKIPAQIVTDLAKQKHLIPGVFIAIHTFGRDLKANVHFHLSTTSGGLSLDNTKWISKFYIHHEIIKKMWKYQVIMLLRDLYNSNQIVLPPELKHISNNTEFNIFLNSLFQKSWVVHLQKVSCDHRKNIKYLGRYLKRPPISETRIKKYDGINITYQYHDHHENNNKAITMPVYDFIGRLIKHIPDKNFRVIRYYNWLSNRQRGKLLPHVYQLIKQIPALIKEISWFTLFYNTFGYDPLLCKPCNTIMELTSVIFPKSNCFLNSHKEIAISVL